MNSCRIVNSVPDLGGGRLHTQIIGKSLELLDFSEENLFVVTHCYRRQHQKIELTRR